MEGYKELVALCEKLGLDPNKKGENNLDDSEHFIFAKAFDLTEIRPGSELIQVMELGRMIRNLLSQTPKFKSYNFATPSGPEAQKRDSKIEDVCKTFQQIMLFHVYITPGLSDKKLFVHNGRIYELNHDPRIVAEEAIKRVQNIIARYRDK